MNHFSQDIWSCYLSVSRKLFPPWFRGHWSKLLVLTYRVQQGPNMYKFLIHYFGCIGWLLIQNCGIVKPVVTYGSVIKQEQKKNWWTFSEELSRMKLFPNEEIRRRPKRTHPTTERLETRQLIRYGGERWPKRAFHYTPMNRKTRAIQV